DVNQIPENVKQSDVTFLNAVNAEAWHGKTILGNLAQPAAVLTGKRDGQEPFLARRLQRINQIGRLPAGRNCQGHVARFGPESKLVDKNLRIVLVVGDCGQHRYLAYQIARRQSPALVYNGMDEFHRHMLRVTGAAAIAHDPELVPRL